MAVQILVWPLGFLSNAFTDPGTMPSWLGTIAEWNPLSATVAATRELFGNPGWGERLLDRARTASRWRSSGRCVLTAIFFPLAVAKYRCALALTPVRRFRAGRARPARRATRRRRPRTRSAPPVGGCVRKGNAELTFRTHPAAICARRGKPRREPDRSGHAPDDHRAFGRARALRDAVRAPRFARAGVARRRIGADEAEDVLAETFLVAWRRRDDVPDDALPWLYAVAGNVLRNRTRAQRRRAALSARLATESARKATEVAGGGAQPPPNSRTTAARRADAAHAARPRPTMPCGCPRTPTPPTHACAPRSTDSPARSRSAAADRLEGLSSIARRAPPGAAARPSTYGCTGRASDWPRALESETR